MKNIILMTLILIVNVSFAQPEKTTNETVTENFVKSYNSDNYKAIFLMFSEVMQKTLPMSKTNDFLANLKSQAGTISNQKFIKNENEGTYSSYKTTFENAVLVVNISIDNDSKINGLFIEPFVEKISSGATINSLSLIDSKVTKKQSEIIFKNAKDFPNQTQIAFAIIENGNVNYFGLKRNAGTISTVDNHKSIFEIGSITKVFTSTLLSGFVIDKKIELNESINKHLNLPLNNNIKISFKELSNHTSGLPRLPPNLDLATVNPLNPYKQYDESDLKDYLTTSLELPKSLKKEYQYSNLGAGLVGYTLSEIEDSTFDSLLQNKIFSKYRMLNSTTKQNEVKGEFVKGLDAHGNTVSNWQFSALAGAGGILSNVEDLSKFAMAQFDKSNKELELTRQKTFEINDNMDIGLGWHIIKSKDENQWVWHNGGTGGYSSSMAIDIKNKNGIIILSNVSAFNKNMGNIDNLCFELMKTLKN